MRGGGARKASRAQGTAAHHCLTPPLCALTQDFHLKAFISDIRKLSISESWTASLITGADVLSTAQTNSNRGSTEGD